MSSPFKLIPNGPKAPNKHQFTEAEVVAVARELLAEHAAARQSATEQANRVCGECQGPGVIASVLMPGEVVPCVPCAGSGQPNEHTFSLPALTQADHVRFYQLQRLLLGPYRPAVLAVIKELVPDLYPSEKAEEPMSELDGMYPASPVSS